ncbi:Hypothetical protein NTJ_05655 [Nesidiocoris tenuis]|uniref:Uncharacterized protein n=1 Tax=Nesidiocoris tenuis TaxID=355587 RepID=A0ABN7AKU3_9HEMI|nr:Hypothetical protein NTJ_05655 [Nesidiocoris tenuis]
MTATPTTAMAAIELAGGESGGGADWPAGKNQFQGPSGRETALLRLPLGGKIVSSAASFLIYDPILDVTRVADKIAAEHGTRPSVDGVARGKRDFPPQGLGKTADK